MVSRVYPKPLSSVFGVSAFSSQRVTAKTPRRHRLATVTTDTAAGVTSSSYFGTTTRTARSIRSPFAFAASAGSSSSIRYLSSSASSLSSSSSSSTCLHSTSPTASDSMAGEDGTTTTTDGDPLKLPANNPLLRDWSAQPFHLPPFDDIETKHFQPALEVAMEAELQDLQNIIDNPDEPTFENVIAAYDQAGSLYERVSSVYSNMCSSMNIEELQKVQTIMSPIMSRHGSKAYVLPGLFDKIDAVYKQVVADGGGGTLTPEQIRLVERIHMDFVRYGGAQLDSQAQAELADIKAQLASLRTKFEQNVMKDETDYQLPVTLQDLDGCPSSLIDAAKQAATERRKSQKEKEEEGKTTSDGGDDDLGTQPEYIITLSRSLIEPFLMFCTNRELRKVAWEAWTQKRGQNESTNNVPIAVEMLKLRQRQAKLYGYKTFAEYQCVDRMAKTPKAVMELLENVWNRAKVSANTEREALEEYVRTTEPGLLGGDDNDNDNDDIVIEPWDWRFVAEKVRQKHYDLDESMLKPYFSLDNVRSAMFDVSNKLFGLKYIKRSDIQAYHPNVDIYEVTRTVTTSNEETKKESNDDDGDNDDKLAAIFIHDNFSRPFKMSGAWMSEYRTQTKNLPSIGKNSNDDILMEGIPVISNNNNFAMAGGGGGTDDDKNDGGKKSTTLLSHDGTLYILYMCGKYSPPLFISLVCVCVFFSR